MYSINFKLISMFFVFVLMHSVQAHNLTTEDLQAILPTIEASENAIENIKVKSERIIEVTHDFCKENPPRSVSDLVGAAWEDTPLISIRTAWCQKNQPLKQE